MNEDLKIFMVHLYIIEKIGELTSAIMLVYFFNKIMPPKNEKHKKLYEIFMIIFYTSILSIMTSKVFCLENKQVLMFILSYYTLVLIYPLFFRRGRISEKFFVSWIYIGMTLVSSFIIHIIFAESFNVTLSDMLFCINLKGSISMIVNRLVQFVLVIMLLRNIDFMKYIKDSTLYIGGIVLFVNHILIFMIERDLIINFHGINLSIMMAVLIICISQILSIYMLNTFSKEIEEKLILKVKLDRKIHDEEIIDMYTKMSGWRHDFRNHINMILGLLEVSAKEEAISYINEINDSINELDKNIYTENIAINSILMSKMKVIEKQNIDMILDLKINSEIKISNVDMCIILGNLLDNSIEACSFINEYRFIELTVISENSRFVIKIRNNTNGYMNLVRGKFLTTKKRGMNGIGLTQVDNIVKKYNGYIDRKHENNIFTTYIMIQEEN